MSLVQKWSFSEENTERKCFYSCFWLICGIVPLTQSNILKNSAWFIIVYRAIPFQNLLHLFKPFFDHLLNLPNLSLITSSIWGVYWTHEHVYSLWTIVRLLGLLPRNGDIDNCLFSHIKVKCKISLFNSSASPIA